MRDIDKTKDQLIKELNDLRHITKVVDQTTPSNDKLEKKHKDLKPLIVSKSAEQHIIEQNEEIVEYLKGSRLFSTFPKRLIKQLLLRSKPQNFLKGITILQEGEINTKVYFLLEGEVSLYAGGQLIMNLRRKGDIFGERSALRNYTCLNTVITVTPVKLFSIDSADIENYTDIGTEEVNNFLYQLLSIIMTDKLALTTDKAKKYEATQVKLLKEIKEHKQAEIALKTSEEKYRNLIESAPEPVVVIKNKSIVYANPMARKLIGYSEKKLYDTPFFELIAQSNLEAAKKRFEERKSGYIDPSFETQLISKNNENKWAKATSVEIEWEGKPAFLFFLIDISERKIAEQALLRAKERFQQVAENAQEWIWETDAAGLFTYGSPVVEKILGYKPEEIIGKKYYYDFFHPEEQEKIKKTIFEEFKSKRPFAEFINRNINKDGVEVWISTSGVPLYNEKGNFIGYRGANTNITPRRQAEEALKKVHGELEKKVEERTVDYKKAKEEAERSDNFKSEFLSNMSHELRTPMHGILSFSKFGIDKLDDNTKEKNLHYFTQIRHAGKRLMNLLGDLLDLSSLEAGKEIFKMKSNNILKIAKDTVTSMEVLLEEKRLSIKIKDPEIETTATCDEQKIGQVMRHLLSNAIKFTPSKGKIAICFSINHLKTQDTTTISSVCVSVEDNGIGVPKDELDSVFDKFFQSSKTKTNAGGTGLGLSICKEIISTHRGKIWAENNPEGGLTISFQLLQGQN